MTRQINIAQAILSHRREAGLTQQDLADRLGVSKAAVSKWEKGLSLPDIALLPRLASLFASTIDDLIGYAPQLDADDIRRLYQRLASQFATQPYAAAMAEADEVIEDYYSCYPLLLQMAVLLANHHDLAEGPEAQAAMLERAQQLCQRVKTQSGDVELIRQANAMQAAFAMMRGRAEETIALLAGSDSLKTGNTEVILAGAYQMTGDCEAAQRTLQAAQYRSLLSLIASATVLLQIHAEDAERFDAVLARALAVAEAFDLARLHPNVIIQLHAVAAAGLVRRGQLDQAVEQLQASLEAYQHFTFPLILHGDDYFDRLGELFADLDLGGDAPRDAELVKRSYLAMFADPSFAPLSDLPAFKNLVAKAHRLIG